MTLLELFFMNRRGFRPCRDLLYKKRFRNYKKQDLKKPQIEERGC
jgi:hypothetical protein